MGVSRRQFLALAGFSSGLSLPSFAAAETFPSRAITMIVPIGPGGLLDTVARIIAQRMQVALGQSVIVENVTGASGSIGVGRVARAAPDGYTLCYGAWTTHVANGAVYRLPYDVVADFEPIAMTCSTPWIVVVSKKVAVQDLKGLIAWLKANAGTATAGTSGVGGPGDIGGVLFEKLTGTHFQFVPYRGTAPAMQDLITGRIDMMIADPITTIPQYRSGEIKALAILGSKRWAAVPDIPTIDEAGLPGFYLAPWEGIWAPRGTPANVVNRLNTAVVGALADPAVVSRLTSLPVEIASTREQTPSGFAAFQKAEIARWWPVIKGADIKGD